MRALFLFPLSSLRAPPPFFLSPPTAPCHEEIGAENVLRFPTPPSPYGSSLPPSLSFFFSPMHGNVEEEKNPRTSRLPSVEIRSLSPLFFFSLFPPSFPAHLHNKKGRVKDKSTFSLSLASVHWFPPPSPPFLSPRQSRPQFLKSEQQHQMVLLFRLPFPSDKSLSSLFFFPAYKKEDREAGLILAFILVFFPSSPFSPFFFFQIIVRHHIVNGRRPFFLLILFFFSFPQDEQGKI